MHCTSTTSYLTCFACQHPKWRMRNGAEALLGSFSLPRIMPATILAAVFLEKISTKAFGGQWMLQDRTRLGMSEVSETFFGLKQFAGPNGCVCHASLGIWTSWSIRNVLPVSRHLDQPDLPLSMWYICTSFQSPTTAEILPPKALPPAQNVGWTTTSSLHDTNWVTNPGPSNQSNEPQLFVAPGLCRFFSNGFWGFVPGFYPHTM